MYLEGVNNMVCSIAWRFSFDIDKSMAESTTPRKTIVPIH